MLFSDLAGQVEAACLIGICATNRPANIHVGSIKCQSSWKNVPLSLGHGTLHTAHTYLHNDICPSTFLSHCLLPVGTSRGPCFSQGVLLLCLSILEEGAAQIYRLLRSIAKI